VPRKPGMSRDDLLETNVKVMKRRRLPAIKKYAPESVGHRHHEIRSTR
jgi:malate/lactate dehydrogenase